MRKTILTGILGLALAAAALALPGPVLAQNAAGVMDYAASDARMNAAIDKARATMPRFLRLMADHRGEGVSIKYALTQNGKTEHIWVAVSEHRDGTFIGTLANKPVNGDAFKEGDRVEVPAADVEDWLISSGDTLFGGYTVRVMAQDMGGDEGAALLARLRD